MNWRDLNKTKLTEHIRSIVNPEPMDIAFTSDTLAELIAERHYYCAAKGLKPVEFRKATRHPGYTFQAYFPDLGWKSVSWTKCVNGFSFQQEMKAALRDLIASDIAAHKIRNPLCETCGEPGVEVDHVEPEFAVMADQALSLLDNGDEAELLQTHDFLSDLAWEFPSSHKVAVAFLDAHHDAKLETACKACHKANARARRQK